MAQRKFDVSDLERWQKQGLITDQQLQSIKAEEGLEVSPPTEEREPGLNLVTIAYYFGSFLALFSFIFFISMNWQDLSDGARFGVALGAILVVGAAGVWLRFMHNYRTAGGLLLFVATAILPLLIYTIARLMGSWPDDASFYQLRFAFLYLGLGSLAGAIAMLMWTRFPLISLIVAALAHLTIIDIAQMIGGPSGDDFLKLSAGITGGLVLLGVGLTVRGMKRYAFWFKLYGLVGLQITFTALFTESQSALFGLLFLLVYLIFIGVSLRFREVVFLVFGAIGFYTYITRLVFDVFEGEAYFPLVLGFIGLSVVILAVLYQKYGLRLFRRG
ncbi:MAG: DUF2157 domain-containing protein [Dehalococcoidales bacterium]|nr:DUF2157 domain-containing protein [Dehalococcoidales bacterium]